MKKLKISAVVLGFLGALAMAGTASAHASLTEANPADGDELDTAPDAVSLTFNEELDADNSDIAVVDPDEEVLELAPAEVDDGTITQPMEYTTAGTYTVSYRILSADGHNVEGNLSFTVDEVPTATTEEDATDGTDDETADESNADDNVEETADATDESAHDDGQDDESGNFTKMLLVLLGAATVVAIVIVFVKSTGKQK
ncbi:copper resistance CopC family protein [Haloglycomyces albus]|uniref:copper resistance CopC family protein n=1 Tax=Haloglycomyces albus TaxID=526067 RepID=UPI00046D0286|nr:copper resistance protein CopC [Haloglycomyces albus]